MANLPQDRVLSPCRTSFSSIEEKVNGQQQCCPRTNHCSTCTISDLRDEIFQLGAIVGRLCTFFLSEHDHHPQQLQQKHSKRCDCAVVQEEQRPMSPSSQRPFWEDEHPPSSEESRAAAAAHHQLGEVFLQLFVVAGVCGVHLRTSILKKVELNGRKYPVELCKGKSGKYTNYSEHTGITTTEGQSTIDSPIKISSNANATTNCGDNNILEEDTTNTIEGMTLLIRKFANERQWHRYHTPRNIALALLGEVGELAELFQWYGDEGLVHDVLSEEAMDKAGQEIADVSIYLLRLCDVCHVSLGGVTIGLLDSRRARCIAHD